MKKNTRKKNNLKLRTNIKNTKRNSLKSKFEGKKNEIKDGGFRLFKGKKGNKGTSKVAPEPISSLKPVNPSPTSPEHMRKNRLYVSPDQFLPGQPKVDYATLNFQSPNPVNTLYATLGKPSKKSGYEMLSPSTKSGYELLSPPNTSGYENSTQSTKSGYELSPPPNTSVYENSKQFASSNPSSAKLVQTDYESLLTTATTNSPLTLDEYLDSYKNLFIEYNPRYQQFYKYTVPEIQFDDLELSNNNKQLKKQFGISLIEQKILSLKRKCIEDYSEVEYQIGDLDNNKIIRLGLKKLPPGFKYTIVAKPDICTGDVGKHSIYMMIKIHKVPKSDYSDIIAEINKIIKLESIANQKEAITELSYNASDPITVLYNYHLNDIMEAMDHVFGLNYVSKQSGSESILSELRRILSDPNPINSSPQYNNPLAINERFKPQTVVYDPTNQRAVAYSVFTDRKPPSYSHVNKGRGLRPPEYNDTYNTLYHGNLRQESRV